MNTERRGFTLIELLVVTVLGGLILLATYNVLITNQRTYTVNAANMQGQQTVRAGLEILAAELREISTVGGDLMGMHDDSIIIRVMRASGVVCDTVPLGASGFASNPPWLIINLGDSLETGDSVWVYAEHDIQTKDDDVWFTTTANVTGGDTCEGNPAQRIRFTGGQMLVADTPSIGGLARAFMTYSYSVRTYEGQPYLVRQRRPGGQSDALVGPLMAGSGLSFEYLDMDGNTTTVGTEVRQILVTVRTQHEARDGHGDRITDSLTVRVFTRN